MYTSAVYMELEGSRPLSYPHSMPVHARLVHGDCRRWYRWRTLGIGQLPVRQPEIRRAGQCGSGTPERLNRMLCPPKSSREASHSGTKTRRMRVEMLCEFRVEDWLLFPAVHWFSPKCRTGGPVLRARMGGAVRHWPISALAAPQPLTERAQGPFPCACLAAGEAGGPTGKVRFGLGYWAGQASSAMRKMAGERWQ